VEDTTTTGDQPNTGAPQFVHSFSFLLLMTLASGIICELTLLFMRVTGLRQALPPLIAIPIAPATGGLVFPLVMIRFVYGKNLREFGVRWIEPGRGALRWLVGSGALVLLVASIIWALLFAAAGLVASGGEASPSELSPAALQRQNPLYQLIHEGYDAENLADVVHSCLFVGFVEELFGRGLLVNALDRRYKAVWGWRNWTFRQSTLLASVLFAAWHINWLSFDLSKIFHSAVTSVTLLPVSFLVCLVYEKTRSIAVTIALHDLIDGGKLFAWYLAGLLVVR